MKNISDSLNQPDWYTPYANMRTDGYVLLAALLNRPPDGELIKLIINIHWDEDIQETMQQQLVSLKQACNRCNKEEIAAEFHRLFVGLGRGELVPYASWYREKMIQSATLAAIRSDLRQLGIIRRSDTHESEDHAGALCEIMALVSLEADAAIPHKDQASFFNKHISPWMPAFFRDMETASDVEFYRAVGAFGSSFLQAEDEYLLNSLHYQNVIQQGGKQNEGKFF